MLSGEQGLCPGPVLLSLRILSGTCDASIEMIIWFLSSVNVTKHRTGSRKEKQLRIPGRGPALQPRMVDGAGSILDTVFEMGVVRWLRGKGHKPDTPSLSLEPMG